ncbi:MAG TPA: enoyl-CoA hydratase-related protein [Candidatus Binataceae bacterium]|nr:enoyl-CoA hydratase-related protein [Candidatus Binataceae bacterium]
MSSNVVLEVKDSVAVVRLDRPEKLNAFTFRMIAEIREAIDRAAADENAVGIVVTGTGRAFSAGLDTTDLAKSASGADIDADSKVASDELPALFSYLLRIPKPVIAAVNGVAAGGGFVLAMMCDLRFAAESASFTTAFSKRGLIAEHGTSWLLPRLVGASGALDLLWSARRIDAAEAMRLGFVDRIVAGAGALEAARAYIRDLAANVSPHSLAVIKSQIYRHLSLAMEPAIRDADKLMRDALTHPDATEGVASFVEHRPPRFARWKGENI